MNKKALLIALVAASTPLATQEVLAEGARDAISIVGSSTVYPFSAAVAEQFGKKGAFKTPKVESTGTGGGIKLFCGGVGMQYPDIANASRAMKKSEFEACQKAGVKDITEVKIGFDGIVIAQSKKAKNELVLTRKEVLIHRFQRPKLKSSAHRQAPAPVMPLQNLPLKAGASRSLGSRPKRKPMMPGSKMSA